VRVPLEEGYQVYGIIEEIHIDDDGLIRQLITAEEVDDAIIADNRTNRNVPIEVSVIAVGYEEYGRVHHLLPPRPPLSLDAIYLCSSPEIRNFTGIGHFSYFRHILRAEDSPVEEVVAAHLRQASEAHAEAGESDWQEAAMTELIAVLRDDYPRLMAVLSAAGDALVR
jgi:hypothetical protein